MLARSQGPRLDPNQENPHRQPHRTPARPALTGKNTATAGPAPVTGGKGVLGQTARTGRVLGAKDRNQGKQGNAPGEFITLSRSDRFNEAGHLRASSLAVREDLIVIGNGSSGLEARETDLAAVTRPQNPPRSSSRANPRPQPPPRTPKPVHPANPSSANSLRRRSRRPSRTAPSALSRTSRRLRLL
ncbi:hypothetical protein AAT19DRAFT_13149 [Rhodotorula toruloides]|uniref:Uncharacterized protein n=1 Tax=Rhodotorula toruloides TaxID=5286 RepID=A0A2T0ADQ2_RHOTO|nr:hypothetical protein AAT19DRAFT_13149 [Rhodotorula toruloides]